MVAMELLSCWVQLLWSCQTLCHCMDCCPPGSSVRGTSQARILEHLELNQKSSSLIDLLSLLEGSVLPQISGYLAVLKPQLYHQFRLVQFSCSVVSDSFQPHEPQQARPPCPSPIPGVHPNPCPLSWWCHPTILSSVVPFSSWPQSFPESGSFQMSQLYPSGGQSIGVSASTSVLPMNTQDLSSCSPRDSQESSPTPQFKSINSSALSFL